MTAFLSLIFPLHSQISLPGTIRTLKLSAAVAKVAELEKLMVDEIELQDQFELRRIEAQRQGIDEEVSGSRRAVAIIMYLIS